MAMNKLFFLILFLPQFISAQEKVRGLADTIGFAHKKWQMEEVLKRTEAEYGKKIADIRKEKNVSDKDAWKMAIAPHDDYTYASYMYPLVLQNVKVKTVILFGVAHKAK